jgi:hypothetical protein
MEKADVRYTLEHVPRCQAIIKEWHEFLGATVKFLHEVQERQMLWHWGGESAVFDGISWLQALWASASAVSLMPSSLCYIEGSRMTTLTDLRRTNNIRVLFSSKCSYTTIKEANHASERAMRSC